MVEQGSSPRVRGTPGRARNGVGKLGIIPACAGNTSVGEDVESAIGDHPRVCGEHFDVLTDKGEKAGSSPRVRGTQGAWRDPHKRTGIIPACAGNTRLVTSLSVRPRDHPRVCGEHAERPEGLAFLTGSSPRVRGTHGGRGRVCRVVGIIPACAGNTRRCARPPGVCRDHPRVCGEHSCS